MNVAVGVAFPLSGQGRHAGVVISELNTWPACAPVNASPAMLPPPAHDSEPGWVAGPFLYGSFIRYSMPVYPGAFSASKRFQCGRSIVLPVNLSLYHFTEVSA